MISKNFIQNEVNGLYGQAILKDIGEILSLYEFYDGKGQLYGTFSAGDYTPTRKVTNLAKKLIKSEARFMFSRTPEIYIKPYENDYQEDAKKLQDFIKQTLSKTGFGDKLVKAARDCFIGKRVALKLWVSDDGKISLGFRPSLEFLFEYINDDADKLKKIIFFYNQNDEEDLTKQRIWKQKFEMIDNKCILNEAVFDGEAALIEEIYSDYDTGLNFIPAYVIINDGLTGDLTGESDLNDIIDNQIMYNRLTSDDIDALKFNMFPQRVAVDASGASLDSMIIAPAALIDLQTDPSATSGQASLKTLEANFGYGDKFEQTVNRIKNDMYEILSVPNISLDYLKNNTHSGKALKALYWDLTCRCEEKWSVWEPALKWLVNSLKSIAEKFGLFNKTEFNYLTTIEHLYPITEDEEIERLNDLKEVEQNVRSKKNYIEKWNINEDAEGELYQIDIEKPENNIPVEYKLT